MFAIESSIKAGQNHHIKYKLLTEIWEIKYIEILDIFIQKCEKLANPHLARVVSYGRPLII